MHTLCIRYILDPNRARDFRAYVEAEQPVIERSGGRIVGYWLATDYAGPNNVGYGFIDFPDLASYERYRKVLGDDPDHRHNAQALEKSGVIVSMERALLDLVPVGR
ncbi:MAG TPA: NIPSNAP family protein [Steroidobacteraceae bacterium]|jgi:hypothetical protein|nr:NIPSNAP family protein [Steroidobacteraceae bacterium]